MNIIKLKERIINCLINFKYAFRLNKPILICRLIVTYIKIIFFHSKLLRYVDFAIDYRCNLSCEHCFATALIDKNRKSISPDKYAEVVKEAMKIGAVNFSFQGGEPLLHMELLKSYIKASNPAANLISVTTNGILLKDDNLKKLRKLGVDILTVSLDSGIPEEHDNFRGKKGCFQDVCEGINKAIACGMNVTIGTVVTHKNIKSEGISKLIQFSQRLKIILMLILAVPVGNWEGKGHILLNKDDMEYLENLVLRYPYVRTDFYANYYSNGCGAVKEILYINPYGDVFACPFIHKKLGNICDETLVEIRDKALKNEIFKDYQKVCIATLKNNLQ